MTYYYTPNRMAKMKNNNNNNNKTTNIISWQGYGESRLLYFAGGM